MLKIGDVARQAGIRASAIRYYERLGLLPPPERESGRRRYRHEVLARLQVIAFARATGFSLREIGELLGGRTYSDSLRVLAREKAKELEGVITRARRMQAWLRSAAQCTCRSPEECGHRLEARLPRERSTPASKVATTTDATPLIPPTTAPSARARTSRPSSRVADSSRRRP